MDRSPEARSLVSGSLLETSGYRQREPPRDMIETLFIRKRENARYRTIFVDGFDYAIKSSVPNPGRKSIRFLDYVTDKDNMFPYVEGTTPEDSDIRTALTLHWMNTTAIALIRYIGAYLDAVSTDAEYPEIDVDTDRLAVIYDRLRNRYSVDDVYEAIAEAPDDTSYVINNGEEVHLCVRCGTTPDKMIILVAVLTHELAHVGSSTPYHDKEFWENYDILRQIMPRITQIKDVPTSGAEHCGLIWVDRDELAGFVDPVSDEDAPYVDEDAPYVEETYPIDEETVAVTDPIDEEAVSVAVTDPIEETSAVLDPVVAVLDPVVAPSEAGAVVADEYAIDDYATDFYTPIGLAEGSVTTKPYTPIATASSFMPIPDPFLYSYDTMPADMPMSSLRSFSRPGAVNRDAPITFIREEMRAGDRECPRLERLRHMEDVPNPRFYTYRRLRTHDIAPIEDLHRPTVIPGRRIIY